MNIFRKAVKDVTLSDGTRIPKGTLVAAASVTAHTDDARYAEPDVFDPFRFARMREGGVEDALKHQLVNTSLDFLPFGHGKHAWWVVRLGLCPVLQGLTLADACSHVRCTRA